MILNQINLGSFTVPGSLKHLYKHCYMISTPDNTLYMIYRWNSRYTSIKMGFIDLPNWRSIVVRIRALSRGPTTAVQLNSVYLTKQMSRPPRPSLKTSPLMFYCCWVCFPCSEFSDSLFMFIELRNFSINKSQTEAALGVRLTANRRYTWKVLLLIMKRRNWGDLLCVKISLPWGYFSVLNKSFIFHF